MAEENSQEKPKFSPNTWLQDNQLTAFILSTVTSIAIAFGAGQATNKTSAQESHPVQGITQDQADVRYLSKSDADKRGEIRDKQMQELKEFVLPKKVYEAYRETDIQRMDRIEKLLERLLEK